MATHDPTTLNRQGYDIGTHYRSAVFYKNEEQQQTALVVINELTASKTFGDAIVTEIAPATVFYPAEEIHGNYYNNNREQGYCQVIIDPKIRKLMTGFKQLVK
jgi:peptide-methionine (S)-S-oxide reductase